MRAAEAEVSATCPDDAASSSAWGYTGAVRFTHDDAASAAKNDDGSTAPSREAPGSSDAAESALSCCRAVLALLGAAQGTEQGQYGTLLDKGAGVSPMQPTSMTRVTDRKQSRVAEAVADGGGGDPVAEVPDELS